MKSCKKSQISLEIEQINSNLKKTKTEKDAVVEKLNIHYHKLLKDGRDTRQDGLRWVIRAIWSLRLIVMSSYLPVFLDEKSIAFLYDV